MPVVFDHRSARAPALQLKVVVAAVSSPPTVGHRPTLQQGKAELFHNSDILRAGNSDRFAETLRDPADIHSTAARLAAGSPASSLVAFLRLTTVQPVEGPSNRNIKKKNRAIAGKM